MDKVYTAQEVADKLKIKKVTVYELIKRGDLKANKVGKQLRVSDQQLNEYLGSALSDPPETEPPLIPSISDMPALPADSAIRQVDYLLNNSGLIINSQESSMVELLRSQLEEQHGSLPMLFSYMNDYNSLYSLYYEKTHLALVSLCHSDFQESRTFIQNMLPGTPLALLHLCDYQIGFYVKKGNPKKIRTLKDLFRSEVTLMNREKGNACRMLLDSLLMSDSLSPAHIRGYRTEVLSHMSLANAILAGKADTGLGDMALPASYPQLEGIPLAPACACLVFLQSYLEHPAFEAIQAAVDSDGFRTGLMHLKGYDINKTGQLYLL